MNVVFHTLPLALMATAFVLIHCLVSGTLPVFSLPAYALIAIACLLAPRKPRFTPAAGSSRCLLGTAILFFYLIVRASLSPVAYLARADIFLMLGCLLVYLITARVLVTARERIVVVGVLVAVGIVDTAVGIAQAAHGEDFMLFGFGRSPVGSRASGMFISPNHLAGFLEIVGVLGLSIAWWSARKPGIRVFLGYCTLCCYIGLLLSQSRGGVLCAVASLLTWATLTLRAGYLGNPRGFHRVVLISVAVLVTLLCIGGWFVVQHIDLQERLATTFGDDIRTSLWKAALTQFQSAPLFGTGAGTHLYLGRLYRQPDVQSDPVHAHSDYLELLAEYGLIGAVGMVIVLTLHAACGLRAVGRLARAVREKGGGSDELALVIGALAAFAGLAAHSAIDFNLHIPGNALVMAFLFGILAQPERIAENPEDTHLAKAPPVRLEIGLPILGGVTLLLALLAWPSEFFSENARTAVRNQEYATAIASAARGQRLDPWNPFTAFHLGEANRLQAELGADYATRKAHREQADQAFQRGLRLFPQDENLLVRRAQVLDRLQRFNEADASYRAAIAVDPELEVLRNLYEKHRALRDSALPTPPR